MIALNRRSLALLVLLGLPSLLGACAADAPSDEAMEDVDDVTSPLKVRPVPGGPVGPVGPIGPVGPVGPIYEPPVTLPTSFDTGARTATSVRMGWYEVVVNPQTQVWRQRYDVDGAPVGPQTLIKTFRNLQVGNTQFVDSAATTDDGSAPDADRLNCYRIVETTGNCNRSQGGMNCLSTPQMACAYTRAAVPRPVGRVQLRVKVGSSSSDSAPANTDIQVRLQSPTVAHGLTPQPRNNSTLVDSYRADFQANSNITYDLKTTNISDLSDITMITIANPSSDDLCINEIELLADNTSAFKKSWSAHPNGCAPTVNSNDAVNGKVVTATFGELRRHPSWANFNPPDLTAGFGVGPHSFVGYRPEEFASYLDTAMADTLKDPALGLGDDAGLIDGERTTLTQVSLDRMHVQQHIVAADIGWPGNVYAEISYDLVIHTDAATCGPRRACIALENADSDSSFWGVGAALLFIFKPLVDYSANGAIQDSLNAMGTSSLGAPIDGMKFCFPSGRETPFWNQGFGAGSLTVCWDS